MRSYENVATTPKKISHGEKLQQELQEALTVRDPRGDLLFCPSVIFPIAHGGTEFGVRIANAYQNNGFDPIVYPLLFSMKTRKQRIPWVENDAPFLAKELEGKCLLTEDWVTTGNTLRGIIQEVERTFPREIRVATIKRDREKSLLPFLDHYCFYVGEHAVYLVVKLIL
jgi:hypoxanthine phosphoribosyltransferase